MNQIGVAMAKLAGVRKAVAAALEETQRSRTATPSLRQQFAPDDVAPYFHTSAKQIDELRRLLPELYSDFRAVNTLPLVQLAPEAGTKIPVVYGRMQLTQLSRIIDEALELRANSELVQPVSPKANRCSSKVFVSHGRAHDWREVQSYIERDVSLPTLELAQEPNGGATIIEKLERAAEDCDSAVIVMTGDDSDADGQARARENVLHEIGYFHGKYGRARVILLHEDGVSVPSNLSGIAYIPFPKGLVTAALAALQRELKAAYGL